MQRVPRSGIGWRRPATSTSDTYAAGTRCATRPFMGKARRLSVGWGAARAAGYAGGMARGGDILLSPVRRIKRTPAGPLRSQPGFHPAARAAQRGRQLRFEGVFSDLSLSRSTLDWGIPVPDAPDHVMYVWVDALTNYITGVGFPDESSDPKWALLAGRSACHWQGHRAVSRRLLARVPDVGRDCAAKARFCAWVSVEPRRENVEVGWQC